jgi:hypothetical protein
MKLFVYPVTENEIVEVVKGKYLAGTDEIPDFMVKKLKKNCPFLKRILHICHGSICILNPLSSCRSYYTKVNIYT